MTEQHSSDMENDEFKTKDKPQNRNYETDDMEDAATHAASENLKRTTISDRQPVEGAEIAPMTGVDDSVTHKEEDKSAKQTTPEPLEVSDTQALEMKENISSPKKKRGRDQDDEDREIGAADCSEEAITSPSESSVNGGRTTRSEPEKKRHRDASVDTIVAADSGTDNKVRHIDSAILLPVRDTDVVIGRFAEGASRVC